MKVSKAAIISKLNPYKIQIVLALVAIVLSTVFVLGMKLQAKWDEGQLARKDTIITQQRGDLGKAVMMINSARSALEAQKQANEKALADERASKAQAERAAIVAEDARVAAQRRANDFKKKLDYARKNPSCEALLSTDVKKVCKL